MAGVDEMVSVRRLPTIFIKLFAVVVRSSFTGLDRYNSGRLACERSGISVSRVLENIEGNIVE